MKLLIYLVLFIAIVPVVYSDDILQAMNINYGRCSKAVFCGDTDLECDYLGDEICPEDYGDWSNCRDNNYGKKCGICDPNCGDCGARVSLDVPDSIAGSRVNIDANAYGYSEGINNEGNLMGYEFTLYDSYGGPIGDNIGASCNDNTCSASFSRTSPNSYCQRYMYGTNLYGVETNENIVVHEGYVSENRVTNEGHTAPYVSISTIDENEDDKVEAFNAGARCNGYRGVDILGVAFLVEKEVEGNYVKVNSQGQRCNEDYCNVLEFVTEGQDDNFIFNFDDAEFNNGNYNMTALAQAWNAQDGSLWPPKNQASVVFEIDKGLAGDVGGTYQGSKVLNIILARIKTWI